MQMVALTFNHLVPQRAEMNGADPMRSGRRMDPLTSQDGWLIGDSGGQIEHKAEQGPSWR